MAIRRLLTGPVGPGSTFSVLAAAAEAARAGRSFALVLPDRAARDHARNELARRIGRCDPRTVFTLSGLARHLLGRLAPRLASPRERDACLAQALAAAERAAGVEAELALRFRGVRHGLLHAFSELEAGGSDKVTDPQGLARGLRQARLDPDRAERLIQAFCGYRQRLADQRLATDADLLHQATRALAAGREDAPVPELVLVDGFTDFTARQRELLLAVALKAGETVVTWPVAGAGATTRALRRPDQVREDLVAQLGFSEAPRADAADDPRPPALRALARDLLGAAAAPCDDPRGLRVVRAASQRDEAAYALARAREYVTSAPQRRWTDVLVVVPDLGRYRAPIEQVGHELGVPVRVRGSLPLAGAPLAQGALALLRGAARFELGALLSAAACPALGLAPDEADRLRRAARRRGLPQGGSPELAVALARELGGAAGQFLERAIELGHAIRLGLGQGRARARAHAAGEGAPAGALGPDRAAACVTTREGCRAARRALERWLVPAALASIGDRPEPEAVAEAAAEVAARRELLALLVDLERLAPPIAPPIAHDDGAPDPAADEAELERLAAALVARVEEEVRATWFEPTDRRRHVLHVVGLREARAWEADLVLVLGLTERDAPRAARGDLFLPEGARRALTGGPRTRGRRLRLETAEDRAADEDFTFYAAATRARRELWLCYPGFDASGGPQQPSRFLEAVRALLAPEAWAAASVLRAPADLAPDELPLLATEAALRRFVYRRLSAVSRPSGPEADKVRLATALLAVLLREPAERERAAIALHDPPARLSRPLGAAALERVYSASELESFATCPFQHFVRYLLGARPGDDLAHSGLDALRQGTVVHAALRRVFERGEEPAAALAEEFEKGARELDIAMEEDAFRAQALGAIEAFVREDDPAFRASTGLEPFAFELPFGPGTEQGPLELEAPALGGTIRLRGQIDRVDVIKDAEGRAVAGFVTDYKLGGREVDGNYLSAMHAGDKLQLPVYLLALEQVLGLRPLGAGFAALGTRRRTGLVEPGVGAVWEPRLDERRVRLHRVPTDRTLRRAEGHVRRIVAGIAQGLIAPSPRDPSDCERCDASDVCRVDRERARKVARYGRALPIAPSGVGGV